MSFLSVEGAGEDEGYMQYNGQRFSLQTADDVHEAMKVMEKKEKIIRIYWPKRECSLCENNVIIVDSPGFGHTLALDRFIENCEDSDIFVLVVSSETELTLGEKVFLLKVEENWSKPNIFILVNKWDLTADDDDKEVHELREKHLKTCVSFLKDELKVVEHDNAKDYVFFVSATEMLCIRQNEKAKKPTKVGKQVKEGFEDRHSEFGKFEVKLTECLDQAAVQTKFGQRTAEGCKILMGSSAIMDSISEAAVKQKERSEQEKIKASDQLERLTKQFNDANEEIKRKTTEVTKQMKDKVKDALSTGQERLEKIMMSFDMPEDPFSCYKETLVWEQRVIEGLRHTIETDCKQVVNDAVEDMKQYMKALLVKILPETNKQEATLVFERENTICDVEIVPTIGVVKKEQDYFALGLAFATVVGIGTSFCIIDAVASSSRVQMSGQITLPDIDIAELGDFISKNILRRNSKEQFRELYKKQLCEKMEEKKGTVSETYHQYIKILVSSLHDQLKQTCDLSLVELKKSIEQLDSDVAQMDKIKSETNPHKERATALLKKLNTFTKEYLKSKV